MPVAHSRRLHGIFRNIEASSRQMRCLIVSAVAQKSEAIEQACIVEELKNRAQFQNKLASICEDMCKEVGAYPKCAQCPHFVTPDSTPGVMTWPELLEHMDNLVAWGQDMLKTWRKQASALQIGQHSRSPALAQKKHIQPAVLRGSRLEPPHASAEQACRHLRGNVQGGGRISQVCSVPRFRRPGCHARRDDLARVARAHGQFGCLGPRRAEILARASLGTPGEEACGAVSCGEEE